MSIRVSLRAAARVAVACLSCLMLPAHAGGWDATTTKALVPPASAPLSALPADTLMDVTVTLKLRNKAALDALVRDQHTPGNPRYGQYLTPAQIAAQFNPTTAQARAVADYLKASGFGGVRVSKNHTLVGGSATAAVVERAFNTRMALTTVNGVTGYINVQDAQVPSALGGMVLSVNGLQNVARMKSTLQQSAERLGLVTIPYRAGVLPKIQPYNASGMPDPTHDAFGPAEFQRAYNATGVTQGSNTVIAISTYGDDLTQVIADLRLSEQKNNLPYVPVEVRVEHSIPAGDASTAGDGEWALDTQSSTGIAGNVRKLVLYTANQNGTASLLWQYANFASDDSADAPTVGNMSYGTCDVLWPVTTALIFTFMPDMASADQAFEAAAAEGRSWHASTGDSGGACSPGNFQALPDTGPPGTMYPASSPYVTAVGGTSLFTDTDGNYSQETAWSSGGGGVSLVESSPSWQDGIVPSAAAGKRGVPDLALDAGLLLLSQCGNVDGASGGCYLGTSLSSPLAAGVWARLQTAHCNSLGFAAPAYYALSTTTPPYTATGFNDVIAGSNGVWSATPGWDYTTGFGSPNVAAVNAALPAATGCTPLTVAPVAQLTAPTSAAKGAQVSFTAAGTSADDTVAWYAIDFGDDPANVQVVPAAQTTFSHAYETAGTYTVSLYARNSHGVVSAADHKTIVIGASSGGGGGGGGGTTAATCSAAPGAELFDDPQFDNVLFVAPVINFIPGTDLWKLQLAQPYQTGGADGSEKLIFTVTTDNPNADFGLDLPLSQGFLPPGGTLFVTFLAPDGVTVRGVRMDWDQLTGPSFYSYIASADSTGAIDGRFVKSGSLKPATGNYDYAAGVLTITVPVADLGLKGGDVITKFNAATALTTDVSSSIPLPVGAASTEDSMPDNAARKGSFAIAHNTACAPAPAFSAALTAGYSTAADASGSYPTSTEQPLQVTFTATTTGADAVDLTYTFYFGDGSHSDALPANAAHPGTLSVTHDYPYANQDGYHAYVIVTEDHATRGTTSSAVVFKTRSSETVTPTPTPTQAALDVSNTHPQPGDSVSASSATTTTHATGTVSSTYAFDFGDGTVISGSAASATHVYTQPGAYTVTLTLTDYDGAGATGTVLGSSQAEQSLQVGSGNVTTALLALSPSTVTVGGMVTFDGCHSYAADDATIISYTFDPGDGTTPVTQTVDAAHPVSCAAGHQDASVYTHAYAAAGTYVPQLQVTDSTGKTVKRAMSVDVAPASQGGGAATAAAAAGHGGAFGLLTLLPLMGLGFLRRRRGALPG